MTEPELVQVLSGRFNVDLRLLANVAHPEFPKKLFENRDHSTLAYALLLMIFERGITAGDGLCDAEKAIVREVRSWPRDKMEDGLFRLIHMFLESDLVEDKFRC